MIRSIKIAGTSTYSSAGTSMSPLTSCNFIYGPNGAGKTTLSRFLSDMNHDEFRACAVQWADGLVLKTVVYNRDFVSQVFNETGKVKGIFSLGTDDGSLTRRMNEIREKLQEEENKLKSRINTLGGADGTGGLKGEMAVASEKLRKACLEQKNKHDADFEPAMKGVRGDSKVFMSRFLEERTRNTGNLHTLNALKERSRSIFLTAPERIEPLTSLAWSKVKILENDAIFQKAIVGKSGVNIAALVTKLQNSDWVSQGIDFLGKSRSKCPFCQQDVPHNLEKDLADFFDDSFKRDTTHLDKTISDYALAITSLKEDLEKLIGAPSGYHDASELARLVEMFDAKLTVTREVMAKKAVAPSTIVKVEGVCSVLVDIQAFVAKANTKISEHNRMVANADAEKTKLTQDFWRYLIDVDLKIAAADYDGALNSKGKAISAITQQIEVSRIEKKRLTSELEELEKKTTGTQATVDKINNTLRSFQFTNFHLKPAGDPHTYQLVRQNGQAAHTTLSEGEKTFVTFLYFYHLAQGSGSSTGIEDARIVVLDDPVSSLDSDILFIVSSLVRELASNVRKGIGPIRQLLVMTHNVYFYKEVTYSGGNNVANTSHWMIRKREGLSEIAAYGATNPIKSSYELLWHDVRKPDGRADTLPNTLRRILESYFKLMGGIDSDKIIKNFEGDHMTACRAMLSWANEGSHGVQDDIHMAPAAASIEVYLDAFRRIFEREEHAGHYRMMMGEDFKERSQEVAPVTESGAVIAQFNQPLFTKEIVHFDPGL